MAVSPHAHGVGCPPTHPPPFLRLAHLFGASPASLNRDTLSRAYRSPLLPPYRPAQKSPIVTKTLTSAALFGLGDFLSQKLEKKEKLDLERLARMTAWGGMFAPLAHVWYGQLDKLIPGQGGAVLAKKVAADQVRRRARAIC